MKYKFKTPPYPHQRVALSRLLRQRGGGLQVPMRYGKSKIAIDFSCCMHYLERCQRVLLITVPSGLGVLQDEIAKHCPLDYVTMDFHGQVLDTNCKGKIPDIEFLVVDFPNVYTRLKMGGRSWSAVPNQALMKYKADIVIVDESHHIGNPSSITAKTVIRLGQIAKFKVIMTGTMFHRKPFFVFGQAKFYDGGASLGGSFTHFKRRIAVMGGPGNYKVMRYKNLEWMMKRMKKWVHIEEYIPPMDPVHNVIHFELEGRNRKVYQEMAKKSIITVDGEAVVSPIVLTRHLRLQQIEGGWVKVDKTYKRVGTNKIDICRDRLTEYMEQGIEKAVVGCRFIPELADVAAVAKRIGYKVILFHGGVPTGKERADRVRTFANYKGPVIFVAQLATGSQAIDLSAADTMMFYSLSESYLIHDQFSRRIEKFKEERTLQYDYLVPRKSRGEVTWAALQQKQDVARFIVRNPRLVEKITNTATQSGVL